MKKSAPCYTEQQLLRQQELISDVCRLFIGNGETDDMLVQSLRIAGEFLGLSQVMLHNYQQQTLFCQYEWFDKKTLARSKRGIPQKLEDSETRIMEALARRDIACYIIDKANREDIISRYGLDSAPYLLLPVFCEDNFWGLLTFSQGGDFTPWSAPAISLGETVAAILSLALSRRSREDHLLDSLIGAQQAADQASQAKVDFLSRMSHEMRTPLNAVIGMTDIALASKDAEKREYCLNRIDNASKHLLHVINDILDMSKIEVSQLALALEEFDFEQTLMDVAGVVSSLAEEKRQDLIINLDDNVPRSLIGDELRIGQVIINLLINAIKFTPDGGVIKLNAARIAEKGDYQLLQVEVADNGIGIPEAQLARLFTSFEQVDGGIARKYGGTGLGLTICKHIVNLMGGDIRVSSDINQGSTFIFTMKLQKGRRQTERRLAGNISRSELRILAVDDCADIREYFLHIMAALGLPCDVAVSGAEALAMIEDRRGEPYNVFFVDWQMPGMDGIELSKKIRALTGYATAIIMISGAPWSEMEQQAVAAGVSLFIPKPLFPSTLINGINECLGVAAKDKAAAKKAVLEGGYNFKNHYLLLAEDMPANREIIHVLLADTQINIDNAENGRQALDMFSQNPQKYSIILMDMNMPEMDGYETTRAIRALPGIYGQNIPIIAMSANVFGGADVEKCLEADVNAYAGKPIEVKRLLDILAGYLQPKGSPFPAAEKKDDSYKPISYSHREDYPAGDYSGFMPQIDVEDGLSRVMQNKMLYFTLLHNFSGRALAGELIAHIRNNDYKQTEQKAHAIKGMAANLGLGELLAIIGDIEGHAKMEVSSIALISELDKSMARTLSSIEQLLEGEGIK
jgi:signal transduction histidine kinase/CheY-like chemotaxis protein/HPt (histidine-containing phosphotransfer) domain-containing protein